MQRAYLIPNSMADFCPRETSLLVLLTSLPHNTDELLCHLLHEGAWDPFFRMDSLPWVVVLAQLQTMTQPHLPGHLWGVLPSVPDVGILCARLCLAAQQSDAEKHIHRANYTSNWHLQLISYVLWVHFIHLYNASNRNSNFIALAKGWVSANHPGPEIYVITACLLIDWTAEWIDMSYECLKLPINTVLMYVLIWIFLNCEIITDSCMVVRDNLERSWTLFIQFSQL